MTEQNLWFAFSSYEWPMHSSVLRLGDVIQAHGGNSPAFCPKVDKNWKEKLTWLYRVGKSQVAQSKYFSFGVPESVGQSSENESISRFFL